MIFCEVFLRCPFLTPLALIFYAPNPILWKWDFITIRWYGIIIALALVVGVNLSRSLAIQRGIQKKLIDSLFTALIINAILGARLAYIFLSFLYKPSDLVPVLAIWEGGLSIYGAFLGGLLTIIVFARLHRINLYKITDIIVPSLAIGQGIGLWGHFFNNEAFGYPTNVPWRLYIPISQRPEQFIDYQYFHPLFLYESIANFVVFFILILLFYKSDRIKRDGLLSFVYACCFVLIKVWIERLRIGSFHV